MTLTVLKALILLTLLLAPGCSGREASTTEAATSRPSSRPSMRKTGAGEIEADSKALARVLKLAVQDGRVDYNKLRQSKSDLDAYIRYIETMKTGSLKSDKERLAFYANAYNAHVLAMVRDRPQLKQVTDDKGFFNKHEVVVGGTKTTLNDLEAKARALGDPRVHFIVNCASGSCPILENTPYDAATLETRLRAATRRYLHDKTHGMKIDAKAKTMHLSQIFNWYAKDFAASGKTGDVVKWIRGQLDGKLKKELAQPGLTVKWKDYDWTLNSASE